MLVNRIYPYSRNLYKYTGLLVDKSMSTGRIYIQISATDFKQDTFLPNDPTKNIWIENLCLE
jgi:hypothetical protein